MLKIVPQGKIIGPTGLEPSAGVRNRRKASVKIRRNLLLRFLSMTQILIFYPFRLLLHSQSKSKKSLWFFLYKNLNSNKNIFLWVYVCVCVCLSVCVCVGVLVNVCVCLSVSLSVRQSILYSFCQNPILISYGGRG